jgi:nucleoid DNA-binding protein
MTEPIRKKRAQPPTIPGPVGQAAEKARGVANGVEKHGAELNLKAASVTEIRSLADKLIDSETVYQAALAELTTTISPELKLANAAAGRFIRNAKKPISCVLGDRWNPGWSETGFLHDKLRCPKKIAERIPLLERLAIFLRLHPECEAPGQDITAARAAELHQRLSRASRAVGQFDTDRRAARAARNKAKKEMHKLVADVIVEIRRKLTAESTLWGAFGLDAPKPRAARPRKRPVTGATLSAEPAETSRQTPTSATPSSPAPAPVPAVNGADVAANLAS